MIFKHTHKERGMWRGWLKSGQTVELSLSRYGWNFGAGIHIHSNDSDLGNRMLFLKFWRGTIVLPLGIIDHPWSPMDGPQWSLYASSEFGLTAHWGTRSKSFDWPWSLHTLAYQKQMLDGSWRDVFDRGADPYEETHHYTYTLRNGTVQNRKATISKRRHVLCRHTFKVLGWPRWNRESIDVQFDGEVGERAGSWKGGTIGCTHDLQPGETMLDALRRMERDREFR